MPAPRNPNVAGAAAARRRIGDRTAAARLVSSGYLVLSPDELQLLPEDVRQQLRAWLASAGSGIPARLQEDAPE